MWTKKVDFFFTNQSSAKVEIAEKLHSRSDHKPLRLSRPHVPGVMLEFERKKKSLAGWSPQTSSQLHELHSALSKHMSLGASVGEIQQAFETVIGGPRTPSGWNQAVLIEELLQLWAGRAPAVSWALEWMPFEILVWADSSSITDIMKRTQEIAYVFGERGLRFNQSSLEILPINKTAEREATRISLNEGMEFS